MTIYIIDGTGIINGPVELPVIPGLGVQMPSNAMRLAEQLPAPAAGHVWALVEGEPTQLADHRGTVYSTATGVAQQHDQLGELPNGFTTEARPSAWHVWQIDAWVLDQAAQLIATRTARLISNNGAYEAAMSTLLADYPASELATFERQRAESLAWQADSTAATAWIDIAAAARGIDRTDYLQRTLARVEIYAQASAYLTGRRQGLADQIEAATTLEALSAIVLDYALPGAETAA